MLAAGDGRLEEDEQTAKAFDRVKAAIAENEKTITLSVGQLTVGITIPEWSGVLMLCNMQSPSSYMQAAFRAQNPCVLTQNGQRFRKETAYVFDFDPARTLIIFDEFANNLSKGTVDGRGTAEDRQENIKRLLNFFPVLGEDDEGRMVELDAASVLTIPRKIKSEEVVRRGFMSNFLFQNISNIFSAPTVVKNIVEKLTPAQEETKSSKKDNLESIEDVSVDADGNVDISNEIIIGKTQDLFGEKIYEELSNKADDILETLEDVKDNNIISSKVDDLVKNVKDVIKKDIVAPIADNYDIKSGMKSRIEKEVERDLDGKIDNVRNDFEHETRIAKVEFERKRQEAATEKEIEKAEEEYNTTIEEATNRFVLSIQETVHETIQNKPAEIVETIEKSKAEQEKRTIEDEVRAHLRGFSRTIPSFIMAYGDEDLTLANFDDYTEDEVFFKVTGITEEDFRFLRDGGAYEDPETGESKYFEGQLFDEVVFNDSIKEFWKKKIQLANYFDESQEEDIFDYIPPQKTNQIFTPRWVVEKMTNQLEEENPGCFDDPNKTFADLYMKSGLYITEIVKRLYRSEAIKAAYPDDRDRIRHILRKQVYGMAPTRIIYLIATNYILGFDEELKSETKNFVEADAAEAAKNNELPELVEKHFGKV